MRRYYHKTKLNEQALQEWFTLFLRSIGVLFCASAGGMRTCRGTAIKMKKAGYQKGFPDMMILEPRGRFHGLFIELKIKNRPTQYQIEWQTELLKKGYCAFIMPKNLSFQEAQEWLENTTKVYLNQEDENHVEECINSKHVLKHCWMPTKTTRTPVQ